jgi:hypothetical protein
VILDKNNKKWKEIVIGKFKLQTDNLGLQMFLKRATSKYTADTPAADIEKAVAELHAFFVKYERILQKEIALISK